MTRGIVTLNDLQAARSWAPSDFLRDPCGECLHGKGQHFTVNPNHTIKRGVGSCSQPGCPCRNYSDFAGAAYHGA